MFNWVLLGLGDTVDRVVLYNRITLSVGYPRAYYTLTSIIFDIDYYQVEK